MLFSKITKLFSKEVAELLFYEQPTLQDVYSEDSSGEFVPERLVVDSRPDCFLTIDLCNARKKLPKTIVITDPTLFQNINILNKLCLLQKNGFTLYRYGNDELTLFDSTQREFTPSYRYTSQEILHEVIKKNPNVTADQTVILGYFGTRQLPYDYTDIRDFLDLDAKMQTFITSQAAPNEKIALTVSDPQHLKSLIPLSKAFQVSQLELSSKINISDEIFDQLSQYISALEVLNLSWNNLSEVGANALCKFIGQHSNLKRLSLVGCHITVAQIEALTDCPFNSLEELDLTHNDLSNVAPDDLRNFLGQCTHLKKLVLEYCKTTPAQLKALTNCSSFASLEELDLSSNDLSNVDANALCKLFGQHNNLKRLSLVGCEISVAEFEALKDCHFISLEELDLRANYLSNVGANALCKFLGQFNSLEKLVLSINNLSNVDPDDLCKSLGQHINLKRLTLWSCDMTVALIKALADFPFNSLEELDLSSNKLSKVDPDDLRKFLGKHTNLKELSLSYCKITVAQIKALADFSFNSLEKLDLSGNDLSNVDPEDLCKFLGQHNNLKRLRLWDCHMTVAQIKALANFPFNSLEILDLRGNNLSNVDPDDLCKFLGQHSNLKRLSLWGCQITVAQIEALADFSFNSLEELDLSSNNFSKIDPDNLRNFLGQCTHLKKLVLEYCKTTPAQLKALTNCPQLASLEILGMRNNNPYCNTQNIIESYLTDTRTVCDPSKTFETTEYFSEIDPADYRLEVIQADPQLDSFKLMHSPANWNKKNSTPLPVEYPSTHLKKGRMLLKPNTLNILPSLHPKEVLATLKLPENVSYELFYDETLNFYAIQPICCSNIPCEFRLQLPDNNTDPLPNINPQDIADLKDTKNFYLLYLGQYFNQHNASYLVSLLKRYFEAFSSGELIDITEQSSEEEKLEAIISQCKGSCRHRANAFLYVMEKLKKIYEIDIPTRIIENNCHQYIEVSLNGYWHSVKLGGFSAKVIKNQPIPEKSIFSAVQTKDYQYDDYDEAFAVWDYPTVSMANVQPIYLNHQKSLLLVDTIEQANQLYLSLNQQIANENNVSCFGINTPEEMTVCDTLSIPNETDDSVQSTYKIVSGEFKTFLNTQDQSSRCLLINWQNFNAREIAAAQSCMDDPDPKIGNTPLHPNTRIIGIMTKAQFERTDNSFSSRVGQGGIVKLSCDDLLKPNNNTLPTDRHTQKDDSDELSINLFGEFDQSALIGKTQLTEKGWHFEPGALARCCEENISTLIIQNRCDDPRLKLLINKVLFEKAVWYNGAKHHLPKTFRISYEQVPYDFHALHVTKVTPKETIDSDTHFVIINHATINCLFGTNEIKDGRCFSLPGMFTQNGSLDLLFTETLPQGLFAKILAEAKKQHCEITLSAYSHVVTPADIQCVKTTKSKKYSETLSTNKQTSMIVADDTVAFTNSISNENAIIVPVTKQTTYADLIYRLSIDPENKTIIGNHCFLLDALTQGKTIYLSGTLSPKLFAQLETLFLPTPYLWINNEKFDFPQSRVIYVTKENTFVNRVAYNCTHTRSTPSANQTHTHKPSLSPKNIGKNINKDRTVRFKNALLNDPIVFIEGKTSVGKSYFMKNLLPGHWRKCKVYTGFEALQSWINVTKKDAAITKILFIDEANMQDAKQLSTLLGIYGTPRGIVIEGKFYPISDKHKIVFAGNPNDYQYRDMPYFSDYGIKTIRFEPLPKKYLEHKVLGTLWNRAKTHLTKNNKINRADITDIFLKFYDYAQEVSDTVTARNLQMMLLHFLTYLKIMSTNNSVFFKKNHSKNIAYYIAYLEIAGQLTKEERRKFKAKLTPEEKENIKKNRKIEKIRLNTITVTINQDFVVTPCYHHAILQLEKLFAIRHLKNDLSALSKFGYQGITLEGLPGIGKTELVKNLLAAKGLKTGEDYYQLNPHNITELKSIVKKCVTEGLILLVDEANLVMPLLEMELNAFLQGEQINSENNQKTASGFMLICTQNPSCTHAGRLSESASAKNRHLTVSIEPTENDLKTILEKKYQLPAKEVEEFIEKYQQTKGYAQERGLSEPTPRELFFEAAKFTTELKSKSDLPNNPQNYGKTPLFVDAL